MNSMLFLVAIWLHCFVAIAVGAGAADCSTVHTPLVLESDQQPVGNLKIDSFEASDGSGLKFHFDSDVPITYVYFQDIPSRLYDFSASPVKSLVIRLKLPCLGAPEYLVSLSVQFEGFQNTEALVNVNKNVGCLCAAGLPTCQEFTDYLWTDFTQAQGATIKTTSVESVSGSAVRMFIDALNFRKLRSVQVQQGDKTFGGPFTAPFPTKIEMDVGEVLCNTTTLVPNFSQYGLKVVTYSVNLEFEDGSWARGDVLKQVLCNCP